MNRHTMDEAEEIRAANRQLGSQRPPHHADFDRITYILRVTDSEMDRGGDIEPFINMFVDPQTLIYVADQRALRALDGHGIHAGHVLFDSLRPLLGAIFIDGWINGRQFGNEPRSQ